MKKRYASLMIPAVIVVILAVVVGFFAIGGNTILGLSDADVDTLISLLPGVFVLFVAFYGAAVSSGFLLGGSVAGIGLALAYLVHLLDEANLLIPNIEMTGPEVSILAIVVFLIIAVGLVLRERY